MVLASHSYYFPPKKPIFNMLKCEVTLIYYKSDVGNKGLMQCKSAYVWTKSLHGQSSRVLVNLRCNLHINKMFKYIWRTGNCSQIALVESPWTSIYMISHSLTRETVKQFKLLNKKQNQQASKWPTLFLR